MRMRLPVLIVAGVLLLGSLFSPFSPLRLADIILRNPIVLLQQAAARVLGIFIDTGAPTRAAVLSPAAVSDTPSDQSQPPIVKDADVKDASVSDNVPRRGASSKAARQQQGAVTARSISSPERLRPELSSVTLRGAQALNRPQPAPGFELSSDTVAGNPPVLTGVEPPAAAQPPVSVQPPTDLQPPSGLVPPGDIPLVDGLVPPGGILNPGALLAGVLPAGTVISPGGLAQLPGGIQVQLPSGTQPGQIQIGPVQVGPAQSGPIQIGPIQIGTGQPGSGQPGSGQPGSGPVQGGPIQIGPIQITLP